MLKIDGVSKSYGEVKALSDISLEVNPGEIFGLIGPDGAGKTSLFRMVATLLLPDKGRIQFNGFDAEKNVDYVRRNIGYMPGRFSLYQDLSVRENLEFFATIFNTTIEKNKYLIKGIYSQLEPFEHRRAGALSGGMKQKLALSCALIHKPELLLLDEPTTGVDAVSRKEFWNMLRGLKDAGISILVSTPYMDESKRCDRIALIQNGHILDIDSPEKVVSKFDKRVYRVRGKNLYSLLNEIRKMDGVDQAYPFGSSLHVYTQAEREMPEGLKSMEVVEGIAIEEVEADIEDSFMNLMTKEQD